MGERVPSSGLRYFSFWHSTFDTVLQQMKNVSERESLESESEGNAWVYYLRSTPNIAVHVLSVDVYLNRKSECKDWPPMSVCLAVLFSSWYRHIRRRSSSVSVLLGVELLVDDLRGGGGGGGGGGGLCVTGDTAGGMGTAGTLPSGNGCWGWVDIILGHVFEGIVNGSDAYGGGTDTPYADSKGSMPYPNPW